MASAHVDTFVRDNLPPADEQPEFRFDLPELRYPARLNAAVILDRAAATSGDATAVLCGGLVWTYQDLKAHADQIAGVLSGDASFQPGNRVLLHGPNAPWTIAAWFGIVKAGGVVVATMPLLRSGEVLKIVDKAQISHAIVHTSVATAVDETRARSPYLKTVWRYGEGGELEALAAAQAAGFANLDTASDDPVLIAFTSGTTGVPKGCVHYHRDVLAMADTFSRHILQPQADEVFCGTPPYAFTFGLGAIVIFPVAAGATIAIPDKPAFEGLCDAIERHAVTTLFTAPTGYRALLKYDRKSLASLKKCVSAGETLPEATSNAWHDATGIRIIDGIGATEMIHIFISAAGDDIRPGATGKPVPGYVAEIQDEEGRSLPRGETGRLAVRGPTGCRYLADPGRQRDYVRAGWNVTGDIYRLDEDGYFWFVSRADDMIVSSGYNISAPEVENALLLHPAVVEAAVIGAPDEERGQICKAFVVLRDPAQASTEFAHDLQNFVKGVIAPYKYPRAVEFVAELPKTQTGKLQRFRLREASVA